MCGDCKDGKGVSALLNNCVDCSNVNGILIAVLRKENVNCTHSTISNACRVVLLHIVIMDTLLISALLFKEVKFSALFFPVIFFTNVSSVI